jgi:hypothetical protein
MTQLHEVPHPRKKRNGIDDQVDDQLNIAPVLFIVDRFEKKRGNNFIRHFQLPCLVELDEVDRLKGVQRRFREF